MRPRSLALAACTVTLAACASRMSQLPVDGPHVHPADSGGATAMAAMQHGEMPGASSSALPAGAADAAQRLTSSPRHGEWVTVPGPTGAPGDSVRAWLVYPERRTNAPVVVVIHEIFGLTPWIRAVADQLAADGFIAIAPDLLTGRVPTNATNLPDSATEAAARAAIGGLNRDVVQQQLDATARYAMALPAASKTYGVVGFCWGGGTSFAHAVHAPSLGAAVVYYGPTPPAAQLSSVRAPVLGLYGENDQRVNATIPAADSTLSAMGRTYVKHIYTGAGHGFLRQQTGANGANMEATRQAWPETVRFFRQYLGS
ncbi:MAG TPA: dienelactone hydrolase family protein [Gemmatimonadaceae bacterium]|nr:dienelactone hydrolase family protein [Gemmatimonadaceae bacterium]